MPFALPRILVDLSGPVPRASAPALDVLRPGELTDLLSHDARGGSAVAERLVPLAGRRWAVGRRVADLAVWRIVDEDASQRIGHPAWLWTRDEAFDPDRPEAEIFAAPPTLPLRNLLQHAAPASGNRRRLVKALAATVATLRRPERRPIAIVAPPEILVSASTPARWFALSLLTCLPPAMRDHLRIAWGEIAPDPQRLDVVLCAGWRRGELVGGPEGFEIIDAVEPPPEGDDLVAYYLRARLHANDPEAVEAAAYLEIDGQPDPWGAGVARRIAEGVPGVSDVDEQTLERDPEAAVRALSARFRAGAALDDGLIDALVRVTLKTRDPRPWTALEGRPAVERARAVRALLDHTAQIRPKPALVRALGTLYPPGAEIEPWIETLMRWIHAGSAVAVEILENTLLDWPASRTRATRASLWSEVVRALVGRGEHEGAMAIVVSTLSREMAREGAARVLVSNWCAIPASARSTRRLNELIGILADAKDGDQAVALLFRHLRDTPTEVAALVRRWTDLRGTNPDDPLLAAIRDSKTLAEWVTVAIERGEPREAGEIIARCARGPDDPVWLLAEEAQAALYGDDPRNRFVALHNLPGGLVALEQRARALIGPALEATVLPDYELAEVARAFVDVPDSSPIWAWIAITATVPDHFDDSTVDATTVAFCQAPPEPELQRVAALAARALGRADRWEVIDHARWIVRLCLAPDDGTGFHLALATALAQGLASRADAVRRMADITHLLLDLEPDHPALIGFLQVLLPHAWLGGVPRLYLEAVPRDRVPPTLAPTWDALARV